LGSPRHHQVIMKLATIKNGTRDGHLCVVSNYVKHEVLE
jgi:hypothetical protein